MAVQGISGQAKGEEANAQWKQGQVIWEEYRDDIQR